jgi:hypothetical protein
VALGQGRLKRMLEVSQLSLKGNTGFKGIGRDAHLPFEHFDPVAPAPHLLVLPKHR